MHVNKLPVAVTSISTSPRTLSLSISLPLIDDLLRFRSDAAIPRLIPEPKPELELGIEPGSEVVPRLSRVSVDNERDRLLPRVVVPSSWSMAISSSSSIFGGKGVSMKTRST